MNKTLLIILLLLPIFAISANALYYCMDTESNNYCVGVEQQSTADLICPNGPVVNSNSDPLVLVTCDQNNRGCCCSGDDSGISYKDQCTEEFHDGITDPNVCSDTCSIPPPVIDPTGCEGEPPQAEFKVEHVKGQSHVRLSWSSCGSPSIKIERTTSDGSTVNYDLAGGITSYTDTDTEWSTQYDYQITISYDTGEVRTDSGSITTGDAYCQNRFENNVLFCITENLDGRDFVNGAGSCNEDNAFTAPTEICPSDTVCRVTDNIQTCIAISECSIVENFLGIVPGTIDSSPQEVCELAGNCYYDRSQSGVSRCLDCPPISEPKDCFMYKTESSCIADACGLDTSCFWESYDAFGTGICKSNEDDITYCKYISNPQGTINTEAYSPLVTPVTQEGSANMVDFFSTNDFTCTLTGGDCDTIGAHCAQKDDTDSATCTNHGNSCVPGAACVYLNNLCTRYVGSDTNNRPCETISEPLKRIACERDYFSPSTFLNYVSNMQLFQIQISDITQSGQQIPEIITNPYGKEPPYSTQLCVAKAAEQTYSLCHDYEGSLPLYLYDLNSDIFPGFLLPGENYVLRARTTDPWGNVESNYVFADFTYPTEPVDEPPQIQQYTFNLILPQGSVIANEYFEIFVQPIVPLDYCEYSFSNSAEITRMNTQFKSPYDHLQSSDFNLTITCYEHNGESETRTFELGVLQQGETPRILSTNVNPSYLTTRNQQGAYTSELSVITNVPTQCKYSETSTNYDNMKSYNHPPDEYNKEHLIPLSFTTTGEKTIYIRCISNSILTQEESEKIIVSTDPFDNSWIILNSPLETSTNLATYNPYNNTQVPLRITTLNSASCTALLLNSPNNIPITLTSDSYTHNGSATVDETGHYTTKITCTYTQNANTIQGTMQRTFYADLDVPNVNIFFDKSSEKITERTHSEGTSYDMSYNDIPLSKPFKSIHYTIMYASDSGSNQVFKILGDPMRSDLPNTNPYTTIRSFTPLNDNINQDYVYNISATVVDQAGNVKTRTSDDFLLLRAPNPCDVSCGYAACPCDEGDSCNGGLVCGPGLICLDVDYDKVCAPAECEGSCGGICPNECVEKMWLTSPSLGVASTLPFTLSVSTLDNMLCYYENANTETFNQPRILMGSTTPKTTHAVNNYNFDSGQTSGWVRITCENNAETVVKTFNLEYNGNRPKILDFRGNEIITSISNIDDVNAYWATVTLNTDQDTICKYSLTNMPYSQMTNYIGGSKDESKITDYSKTNSGNIAFQTTGSYTIYAACRSRNTLISDISTKTILVDNDAVVFPEITYPNNNTLHNTSTIRLSLNSRSEAIQCESRIGTTGSWTLMNRVSGNNYGRNLTLPEGRTSLFARCTYLIGASQQISQSNPVYVIVDTAPPVLSSPTIKDSYNGNVMITNYKGAVNVSVRANDVISGLYQYRYTLIVNNKPVRTGTQVATNYNDKNFDFTIQYPEAAVNDRDNITVSIKSEDIARNINPNALTSNALRYDYIPPPPECEQECGGPLCRACKLNEACSIDADCEHPLGCISGTCQLRDQVCLNNAFDSNYETDVDCGNTCPACGLGKTCDVNSDCTSGYCDQADNTCKVDYDMFCSNEIIDSTIETDRDCGGMCAQLFDKTCGSGMFCQVSNDCNDGLRCDSEINKCVPEVCYNEVQDEGEEGWNCGGICPFPCYDFIDMISPRFGKVSEKTFDIVLNTSSLMTCSYRTGNMQEGLLLPITTTRSTTHTINDFMMPLTSNNVVLEVNCLENNIPRQRNFQLEYDPIAPDINLFSASPNPITAKLSNAAEGGKIAYWTTIALRTTAPTFCKYSSTELDFSRMENNLMKDTNINSSSHYTTQKTRSFGYESEGTYTLNVACIGMNGKTTSTRTLNIVASPDAQQTPIIVSPVGGSAINSLSFNLVVNSVSNAEFCEARINNDEYVRLTINNSVYTKSLTAPSDGTHTVSARCLYQGSLNQYYGSATRNILIDLKAPAVNRVVATDPNTPLNLTVTLHRTAVNVSVGATDDISGIASLNYVVLVNNNNVSGGRISITSQTKSLSRNFIDNKLNLDNNDQVRVTVTGRDVAGNINSQGLTSNTLRYTFVEPDPKCVDECGGECPACPLGFECESKADCQAGLDCQNNVCVPELDFCQNKDFDSELETDVDCGGDCPGCDIGFSCISNEDCKTGLICNQNTLQCELDAALMCSNNIFDLSYETGVDCGGICAVLLNQTCDNNQACRVNEDCTSGLCKNNVCVQSGPPPKDYCIQDMFGNTMTDSLTNETVYCGLDCSIKCGEGVGCRNTPDCASGLTCSGGICMVSTAPESCEGSDPLMDCGGNCPNKCGTGGICNADSDCLSTHECTGGECVRKPTGPITQPNLGELGYPCFEDGECLDDLRCNKDFVCEEPKGVSWVRIMLFIILISLLVAIGYYAYVTYYQPSAKPDFLKTKEEKEKEKAMKTRIKQGTTLPGLPLEQPIKMEGSSHTLVPPQGTIPPPSPKVDALLERKRKEQKKEEISKLFGAFDDTALDDEDKKEKKPVKNVLKNVPKAEFDEKPVVPVRTQSSEKTFRSMLDEAKKEVSESDKKKVSKVESKTTVKDKKDIAKKTSDTSKKDKGVKDEKGSVR